MTLGGKNERIWVLTHVSNYKIKRPLKASLLYHSAAGAKNKLAGMLSAELTLMTIRRLVSLENGLTTRRIKADETSTSDEKLKGARRERSFVD